MFMKEEHESYGHYILLNCLLLPLSMMIVLEIFSVPKNSPIQMIFFIASYIQKVFIQDFPPLFIGIVLILANAYNLKLTLNVFKHSVFHGFFARAYLAIVVGLLAIVSIVYFTIVFIAGYQFDVKI